MSNEVIGVARNCSEWKKF